MESKKHDKHNKHHKISLIVIIVGIVLITGGVLLTIIPNKDKSIKENKTEEKNDPIKVEDYTNLDESTANWREVLSKRLIELSKEMYQTDESILNEDEESIFVSLINFEQSNLDVSKFRAEGLTCNFETTGINFVRQDKEIQRVPFLDCTNSNEQE